MLLKIEFDMERYVFRFRSKAIIVDTFFVCVDRLIVETENEWNRLDSS
jgi:hypothetical protein